MTVLTARAAPSAADSSRFGSWAYRVGKCVVSVGWWFGLGQIEPWAPSVRLQTDCRLCVCSACRLQIGLDPGCSAVPCRSEVETLSRLRSDGAREGSQRYVSCVCGCVCLSLY
ncbi:hypothetical protein V8C43DRAFT_217126 [Trichoderma afarasin]